MRLHHFADGDRFVGPIIMNRLLRTATAKAAVELTTCNRGLTRSDLELLLVYNSHGQSFVGGIVRNELVHCVMQMGSYEERLWRA